MNFIKNNLLMIIIAILIIISIAQQYQIKEQNQVFLNYKFSTQQNEIAKLLSQVKSKKDSIITVQNHIYKLEKENKKLNEKIGNTNNIDSARGMYIQLRSNDTNY